MKQTLKFHSSVIVSNAPHYCAEALDPSIEAFNNQDYRKALHALLDSIHPESCKKFGDRKGREFHIPHGPLFIYIKSDDEKIRITAPLVHLPEENNIAILRQVAAANFNDLDLVRMVLQDQQLHFEYECPLKYSHPRKIQRVLQEICSAGEKYDGEFTNHFDAQRVIQPRFTPYESTTIDYIYEVIQESCRECSESIRYFESSRQFSDMWQIIHTTFLKIMYVAQPQGGLLRHLQKAINDMERNIPLIETTTEGKKIMEELQKKTKEEISADLYSVETFICGKHRANLQNIRETYEACFKQITAYMEAGEYRKATIRMICKLYEIYYKNQMQEDLDQILAKVLKQTSAQPWPKAAPVLYELWENIMQGRLRKEIPPMAA